MKCLRQWLDTLSPGLGSAMGPAFDELSVMPVYRLPPECAPSRDGAYFRCAEFSIRSDAQGVQRGRMMVALWAPWSSSERIVRALCSVESGYSSELLDRVRWAHETYPDLDFLLGLAADAKGGVRGKVYVMRPSHTDLPAFDEIATDLLAAAGVSRDWTASAIETVGRGPMFFALDLLPDGRAGGKLYFGFEDPTPVAGLLEQLQRPWLRAQLDAVARNVSSNPVGRMVLTLRARGAETSDVTLHAHLASLPTVTPALQSAWEDTEALAGEVLGRPLDLSYVSWLDGPVRSESVYYQVGLKPEELGQLDGPREGGAPIRPHQGLDGTVAGPVRMEPKAILEADLKRSGAPAAQATSGPARPSRRPSRSSAKKQPTAGPDGVPGGRRPGPDAKKQERPAGPVGIPGFPRPRRTRPPEKSDPSGPGDA